MSFCRWIQRVARCVQILNTFLRSCIWIIYSIALRHPWSGDCFVEILCNHIPHVKWICLLLYKIHFSFWDLQLFCIKFCHCQKLFNPRSMWRATCGPLRQLDAPKGLESENKYCMFVHYFIKLYIGQTIRSTSSLILSMRSHNRYERLGIKDYIEFSSWLTLLSDRAWEALSTYQNYFVFFNS